MPNDSLVLRGQPYAPHPFVLEPPRTGKLEYAPGDTFACTLILIGEAIHLLPWIVFSFDQIGERRIGIRGERGQCRLEIVESLSVHESHQAQMIYTAKNEMLTDDGYILGGADVIEVAPNTTDKVQLRFLTPTSLKVNGRWTRTLSFEFLIRNLLRRIRFLSYFHCGEDLEVDAHGLLAAAASIQQDLHLKENGQKESVLLPDGEIRAYGWVHRLGLLFRRPTTVSAFYL